MSFNGLDRAPETGRGVIGPAQAQLTARVSVVRTWVANMRDSGGGPSNGSVSKYIRGQWPEMNQAEFDYVLKHGQEQNL